MLFTCVNNGLFTFVNMKQLQPIHLDLIEKYPEFKNEKLEGRYITFEYIEPFLQGLGATFILEKIGESVNGVPIHSLAFGAGNLKILAWSQMHGNESTTTKAIFDVFNALLKFPKHPFVLQLKEKISFKVIPMLNPDGAKAYTRVNANHVDLNRDAYNLQEKESMILREEFNKFNPDFCFNLHDQRTIFSAGRDPFPATMSFLTPAMDQNREVLPSRIASMKVIAAIAEDLRRYIPNQIGRYDDAYNINCTGDTFQSLEVPTILFEAGHYKDDYNREKSREFVAAAIFSGLNIIASNNWQERKIQEYFNIPENQKMFYDIILRQACVKGEIVDVAIQFKEQLIQGKLTFMPVVEKIESSLPYFGHKEVNCNEKEVKTENKEELHENVVVKKVLLKNEVLIII